MSNQEIIRRKQFCQIVKEIHKSNEYLIVGIDVAKDKHHALMGTTTGKSLLRKLIFGMACGTWLAGRACGTFLDILTYQIIYVIREICHADQE